MIHLICSKEIVEHFGVGIDRQFLLEHLDLFR